MVSKEFLGLGLVGQSGVRRAGSTFHLYLNPPGARTPIARELGSFLVDAGFGQLSQKLVGLLLFLKALAEKLGSVSNAQLLRPGLESSIAHDFVVLDGLGGGEYGRIDSFAPAKILHHALTFFENAVDGLAGLAGGTLSEKLEHLLKPLDLTLRLLKVSFEGQLQFG
jgi:hypothetical protein